MLTKKQFTLLFCVFLFAAVAYQTQPVDALPFDNEYTDEYIVSGDYYVSGFELSTGDVISGYFETDDTTMGLDFFICDLANFLIWDGGGSATGYEVNTDMHTLYFEWTVTYSDAWYLVFSNTGGSSYVFVDIAIDINGDNTPYYSSSTYDHTGFGELLEIDEYDYLSLSLAEGTVIDGHFSTFFTSDLLDFFICDASNFNDWEDGLSADGYSIESAVHLAYIDTFTVPTSGLWYFVFYNNDLTDAITYSYGIEVDTTDAVQGLPAWALTMIGIVAALLLILILCCVCRSKKKKDPTPTTVDHYVAPPSGPATTGTIREREIVRDRVLVICPYCGSKNEQGITTCANCDADL
ncbi:MAG: hypothetical protein RTV72_01400 [Candidatus Thorarchaeota archaeon]